jgi:DNA-binding NarL/FixJ family response regulator
MTAVPIRVMVVDDHVMIRKGLRASLLDRSDVVFVGEAGNGQEALDMLDTVQPDVILLDVQMPRMGGVEAVGPILRRRPTVKVIMLTSFQDQELAAAAMQEGASGYLLKDVTEEDLVATIRLAHAGHVLLPPGGSPRPHSASTASDPIFNLSHREREILILLASGFSNKEIAKQMAISLSTVKFHVSNIIGKLGVVSRTEATAVALGHGLITGR